MDIESTQHHNLVSTFFTNLFNKNHKQSKKLMDIALNIQFADFSSNETVRFGQKFIKSFFQKVLNKQLGLIGLSLLDVNIVRCYQMSREVELLIKGVSVGRFCQFWSAISFQSDYKILIRSIKEIEPTVLE